MINKPENPSFETARSSFRHTFKKAVADVLNYFDASALNRISTHNPAWSAERFDLEGYLNASSVRYENALGFLSGNVTNDRCSLLDVGGFFGAFPLAMARLGFSVTLAEKYSYYYGAFDALKEYLSSEGVALLDADFVSENLRSPENRYDIVTCMALIEHLADSPKILVKNIHDHMNDRGFLIVDVPNIAYWPNRIKLLLGQTIHPPLRDVFESEVPFLGHHREYTISDVRELFSMGGFNLIGIHTFNYTPWPKGNWKQRLLLEWPLERFESFREIIISAGTKSGVSSISR